MNRVDLLCAMERYMMEEFSRRTTEGLKRHTLFRLMLGPFESFLSINVRKEVEKDRQIILQAASLSSAAQFPTQQDIQRLTESARAIDQNFLTQAAGFPINITINYHDIEPVRRQRIQRIMAESHALFRQWQNPIRLRTALAERYDAQQFRKLLYDILHLYSLETRLLSNSIRMPGVLTIARDSVARTVFEVMEAVAGQLAAELTGRLYRRSGQRANTVM